MNDTYFDSKNKIPYKLFNGNDKMNLGIVPDI